MQQGLGICLIIFCGGRVQASLRISRRIRRNLGSDSLKSRYILDMSCGQGQYNYETRSCFCLAGTYDDSSRKCKCFDGANYSDINKTCVCANGFAPGLKSCNSPPQTGPPPALSETDGLAIMGGLLVALAAVVGVYTYTTYYRGRARVAPLRPPTAPRPRPQVPILPIPVALAPWPVAAAAENPDNGGMDNGRVPTVASNVASLVSTSDSFDSSIFRSNEVL